MHANSRFTALRRLRPYLALLGLVAWMIVEVPERVAGAAAFVVDSTKDAVDAAVGDGRCAF